MADGRVEPDASPGGEPGLRAHAAEIFRAALEAADPRGAVLRHVRPRGGGWVVDGVGGELEVPLPERGRGRVFVVGAGKASAPMAQAVEELLGDRLDGGAICVKDGHGLPLRRVEVREASHPLPDERGVAAAERLRRIALDAGEADLVVCVLSGGGSALLTLPAETLSLGDLQAVTDGLLSSGATIGEVNAVRKHLSRVQGGRLALAAAPARVVNLVLSDVVGDRLDVIASGPFSPDPTTYGDARAVLGRRGLLERVPASVRALLEAGAQGRLPETPKPGHAAFGRVVHSVVGSNGRSLEAAAGRARELGYTPVVLTSLLQGEAREAARVLAAVAKQCRLTGSPAAAPACLLAGGETTVTLRGPGKGGRNQELALALALELEGCPGIVGLSAGTDGTDGPTDAAGAVVDGASLRRARERGFDPELFLARNDSYPFFEGLGDLLRTGPTRTNVMDVQVLLVGPHGPQGPHGPTRTSTD